MATRIPTINSTSPNRAAIPELNRSDSTATSEVMRASTAPDGVTS